MNNPICLLKIGFTSLFLCAWSSLLMATDIPGLQLIDKSSIGNDATMMEFATNYRVVEVREAIADCRAGKFKAAIPILEKYATANDVGATYVLAWLCMDGLGIEKSKERAIELFQKNIAGGHSPSMVQLGQLKENDTPAEAVQLYKMASFAGNSFAHIKLGMIMENGALDIRANPKLAFKYFEKAYKAKNPAGTFHLARCYDAGIGVSPNELESTRLFRTAALTGIPVANTVMARRYFEGKGVESDPIAAVGWLLRGSQAGSSEAMVLLGQRYEIGDAIGRDLNRAGQLYSAAAKMNDPAGKFYLARMYLQGTGTKADPVRAYVLLEGAQSLPNAKELFEKLGNELSPDQMALARKKIAEAKANKVTKK